MMKRVLIVFLIIVATTIFAEPGDDIHTSGISKVQLYATNQYSNNKNYTVIEHYSYQPWNRELCAITRYLKHHPKDSVTKRIKYIVRQFINRPYAVDTNIEGESDWSVAKKRGGVHVKQDPIYRTDKFNCQTLVQTILALLHSTTLNSFQHNILEVEYGGGGAGNAIHYYNRNNFVSADFNKVNERHGFLQNVTPSFLPKVHALIDKDNWFNVQAKKLQTSVRVLNDRNGAAMAKRFAHYAMLYPFAKKDVVLHYYRKEDLVHCNADLSHCKPNKKNIAKLTTPAVIEITRDANKWMVGGKPIVDIIGTQLNVSHLGILYDQRFHHGEVIYQKITCHFEGNKKVCQVKPIVCQKTKGCREKMYLEATDAYPNGYYYYQDNHGHYQCTDKAPNSRDNLVYCNRVLAMPIGAYLNSYEYGAYRYMTDPSIVGIHLEKIL